MKHLRLLSSVALVSLLAACGGGGGGMTPGPTVSSAGSGDNNSGSTSTNSPPPQAGPANTVAGYTVVNGSDAGDVIDQALPTDPTDTTVTLDPTAKTITVTSQKYNINDTVTPTDAPTFFQNAANWGAITNSKYPNGYATIASSGQLTSPNDGLQYSEYGLWQSLVSVAGGGTGTLRGAYAAGEQTLAANMPKTGTLNYTGSAQMLATIPGGNGNTPYGLTASVNGTANFDNPNITFTVTPTQAYPLHQGVTAPSLTGSSITLSAPISGNSYTGTTASGSLAGIPIASGSIAGQFNGPQADETSAVFNFAGASGSGMNGIGALGAKAQH